jgi:GAF domain-containing protein
MATTASNPVLDELLRCAAETTAAELGFLLRVDGASLWVVATFGEAAADLRGTQVPGDAGVAGYVVASGQPVALGARSGDPRLTEGVTGMLANPPANVLCVPCTADDATVGALQLLDKADGHFTFDDVELVTLFAGIAGVALADSAEAGTVPDPGELGGELERLAHADPARYTTIARIVEALLARG